VIQLQGPVLPLPAEATIADLVEAQVQRTPDAVALVGGEESLTYAQLDQRANRLARALQAEGVGPEAPVAVLLDRSVALAVCLLAILKAGGACMPLEPGQPPARLAQMVADAAPPLVLSSGRLRPLLGELAQSVLLVDRDWPQIAGRAASRPPRAASPDGLAYVVFTSGSTGDPKGVMLHHRGLVNHNLAVAELYGLAPGDRVLQFCSIGFDVSIEEIFPTWEAGATVVLRPEQQPVLGDSWLRWLERAGITVLNLPTAYWHEWVRDLQRLGRRVPERIRLVIVGGERALGSAYGAWRAAGGDRVRWLNAYGPAECSVLATVYEPPPGGLADERDPPIGRPLANTTAYIDEPTGELLIGGEGVGRGYLNRPRETAARFVEDPVAGRLYRTGDLARVDADGELEFAGRVDEQVKVRGFRVEPAEVQRELARHPLVSEVAVTAREDEPGDKRLVAYLVPAPGAAMPPHTELRRFLAGRLPRYMLPSAFVSLERLPLTPTGKLAREALPPPAARAGDSEAGGAAVGETPVAPRGEVERALASILGAVLGLAEVGREEDFFDLGGHSLQALQVVSAVEERFGVALGVGALFEHPTLAGLAAVVSEAGAAGGRQPPLVPIVRRAGEPIPLSLSQEHMWRLERSSNPPGLFNVTALHRFDRPVDAGALREALALVVERHEELRAQFHPAPHQTIVAALDVELAVCELPASPDGEGQLKPLLAAQDAEPFAPGHAPLWRARLYRCGAGRSVLAATFDHLVCDGTSAYIFLSELTAAYEALAAARSPSLPPLAVQYPDFARWQRTWLTEERLAQQLAYWRGKLAGMPLGAAVAPDHVPEHPTRRIASRRVAIAPELRRAMGALARTHGATVFILAVAAVQCLFSLAGETSDVVLSTTLSGRRRAELDGLIGCFHGVGRLRTDLAGDPPFGEALERARETVLGLFEHQDIPFYRIRDEILPPFPAGRAAMLAAVPIELQYFHTAHEGWAPGAGVVERPGPDGGPDELFFRGHLHPLQVSLLDDGERLWGQFSYKLDFYEAETIERLADGLLGLLDAVTREPGLRLSALGGRLRARPPRASRAPSRARA
jgi:amino acid adenylation domain-containing protein